MGPPAASKLLVVPGAADAPPIVRIPSDVPTGLACTPPATAKEPYLIRAPNKVADQKQRRAHGLAKAGGTLAPSGLVDKSLPACAFDRIRLPLSFRESDEKGAPEQAAKDHVLN
jgi:hypothetical protein